MFPNRTTVKEMTNALGCVVYILISHRYVDHVFPVRLLHMVHPRGIVINQSGGALLYQYINHNMRGEMLVPCFCAERLFLPHWPSLFSNTLATIQKDTNHHPLPDVDAGTSFINFDRRPATIDMRTRRDAQHLQDLYDIRLRRPRRTVILRVVCAGYQSPGAVQVHHLQPESGLECNAARTELESE